MKYPVQVSSFSVFVASLQMSHCLGSLRLLRKIWEQEGAISPSSKPMSPFHGSSIKIELVVIFYATWVIYIVLLISSGQLDNHISWGPQLTILWLAININFSDFRNPDFGFWSLLIHCLCLTIYLFPFSGIWEPSLGGKGMMTTLAASSGWAGVPWGSGFPLPTQSGTIYGGRWESIEW